MDGRKQRSRKPSATSSRPPDEPVFFIDASLGGKVVAKALRAAGARVETHDAHFPPGTPDHAWLAEVGRRRWVVLTKDDRIRYHSVERQALADADVWAFVLTAKGLRGEENAEIFVAALRKMRRFIGKHPGGFIAKVTRSGDVVMLQGPKRR